MDGVLGDVHELIGRARVDQGDRPVVLFGHSLGSLVAHAFVQAHGDAVDAFVLSAIMGSTEATPELAAGIRAAVDAGMADEPLNILDGFSGDGEATRTKFDWLSRDPDEVDKYIADPLCGDDLPLTYGFVAAMLESITAAQEAEGISRVPKQLPVLLIAGEEDPVSDGAVQVRQVERLLRDAGLDVTAKYYPGARHELLNETNRDEVHADVVAWLDRVTSAS
jgi:alpha-beta hydrolase superfamily lysophospholipase